MQFRRIEVRAFRKLGHLVVDNLSDGLNVLVGDNEAGKSTLLAAIRAVLFERHRVGGGVLQAMLPRGHEVRPEIAVDFTLQGQTYRLHKAFNKQQEATLTLPDGQRLRDEAAEERMAILLGFAAPGNRGSRPKEHQGVHGLLWVDQGLAHQKLEAGGSQESLSAALEREVGQVAGGERGRQLLARAEARRDAVWNRYGKPRGAFRQRQDEVSSLEAAAAALAQRMSLYDEKVAALAGKTEILARYRRDDRLAVAARAVEAARASAARAAQLEATVSELQRTEERAQLDRDIAAERHRSRRALDDRLAAAETAARRVGEEAADAAAVSLRAEQQARQCHAALEAARQERRAAEAAMEGGERRAAHRRAVDELAQATATVREAQAIAARRRDALALVERIRITDVDLATLDRLCAARDQARVRRDTASVRIDVEGSTAELLVDGAPHRADEPLRLSRDAVLDLPGFGRLRIHPGGGVEALARALDQAETAVRDKLDRLGQPSRAAAAAELARKVQAEGEATAQARLLAALAPAGLDALTLRVETLTAECSPAPDVEAPVEDLASLRERRAAARQAETDREAASRQADARREAAGKSAAVLGERVAGLDRERDDLRHALADARAAASDEALAATLSEREQAARRAAEAAAAASVALSAADPDTAALALRRAEQAETAIRADIDKVSQQKHDLETELRTLGQDTFGEDLAAMEGRLATAKRQLAADSLEADASQLLHTALAAAQRETKDRWLGPVRDRATPYLRLIHPDSEIVLSEADFSIEHFLRNGVEEPFESLSVGAREQVAVITRLALADILHGAGHPAAVILDDALVNTDESRLERMHLVLQRAAERLQVLVPTCRERDFLGLGAPIHRL